MSKKTKKHSDQELMREVFRFMMQNMANQSNGAEEEKKKKKRAPNPSSGFNKIFLVARPVQEFIEHTMEQCDSLTLPNTVKYSDGKISTNMMDLKQCIRTYIIVNSLASEDKTYLIIDDVLLKAAGEENLKALGKAIYEERSIGGEIRRYMWRGESGTRNYIAKLESIMRNRRDPVINTNDD